MSQRITVLFFCIMAALSKVAMAGPVDENAARNIAAKVEMLRSYERQLAAIADGADVQPCYRAGGTRAVAPLITSKWAQKGQGVTGREIIVQWAAQLVKNGGGELFLMTVFWICLYIFLMFI